jgi:hypothetical protein
MRVVPRPAKRAFGTSAMTQRLPQTRQVCARIGVCAKMVVDFSATVSTSRRPQATPRPPEEHMTLCADAWLLPGDAS